MYTTHPSTHHCTGVGGIPAQTPVETCDTNGHCSGPWRAGGGEGRCRGTGGGRERGGGGGGKRGGGRGGGAGEGRGRGRKKERSIILNREKQKNLFPSPPFSPLPPPPYLHRWQCSAKVQQIKLVIQTHMALHITGSPENL